MTVCWAVHIPFEFLRLEVLRKSILDIIQTIAKFRGGSLTPASEHEANQILS